MYCLLFLTVGMCRPRARGTVYYYYCMQSDSEKLSRAAYVRNCLPRRFAPQILIIFSDSSGDDLHA
jgi:hypothetical protein